MQQVIQHKVYKALTRPALCFSLPLPLLFAVVAPLFLLGAYFSWVFWISIIPIIYVMGLFTKKDEHIYHLLYSRWRCNSKASNYCATQAIFNMQYHPVKIFSLKNGK